MKWRTIPRNGPSAALDVADDFVISHRFDEYTASWRPGEGTDKARHVHLHTFATLEEARAACEKWAADGYKVDDDRCRSMTEYAAGFPRWWKRSTS